MEAVWGIGPSKRTARAGNPCGLRSVVCGLWSAVGGIRPTAALSVRCAVPNLVRHRSGSLEVLATTRTDGSRRFGR